MFTSITQHATEANYMQIIICQLEIAPPPTTITTTPQRRCTDSKHHPRSAHNTLVPLHLAAMFWGSPVFICTQGQTLRSGSAPPDLVPQQSEIWKMSVGNLSAGALQGRHYATGAGRRTAGRGFRSYQLCLLFHVTLGDTL